MRLITFVLAALIACAEPVQVPSLRWNQPEVMVWIQSGRKLGNEWSPFDSVSVVDGFKVWQEHLPMTFKVVKDSAQADIIVTWRSQFREKISGQTVTRSTEERVIKEGHIELALHHENGNVLDSQERAVIQLHEIGHVLGLQHREWPGSIMAPLVRVKKLAPEDIEDVKLLYANPPGTPLRQDYD